MELTLLAIIAGLLAVAVLMLLRVLSSLHHLIHRIQAMALQVSDLLTQIASVSTDLDALIASQTPPADLQPVSDALTALDGKIKAATPVAAP